MRGTRSQPECVPSPRFTSLSPKAMRLTPPDIEPSNKGRPRRSEAGSSYLWRCVGTDGEVHAEQQGRYYLNGGDEVEFLIVDERAPLDRICRLTIETPREQIAALPGSDEIGNRHDAHHAEVVDRYQRCMAGEPVGEEPPDSRPPARASPRPSQRPAHAATAAARSRADRAGHSARKAPRSSPSAGPPRPA